ncbi:MAG: ABC transporter ATP-binding protein [Eubacteriales bacterium]
MKEKLIKNFALSEKGAGDLIKAGIWTAVNNIFLMCSSVLVYLFLDDCLDSVLAQEKPTFSLGIYLALFLFFVFTVYISFYFAYNSSYTSAYEESAAKRITLAETMRKLPLSFFSKKDLSDLTSTIMNDATELEHSFSHYMPPLFGTCASTVLIAVGLFTIHWQMALATLWVVPVSLCLCIYTRKFQRSFSEKSLSIRLAYDDKITECIENAKDMKSNRRQEAHKAILMEQLEEFEKSSMIGELGIGLPVNIALMILKLGIATSALTGVQLLTQGKLDFFLFLVFMVLVTRVFDPIAGAMVNIAAMFHSFLSIDRMKELEQTEIQTGKEEFSPENYDIVFDHVNFSYEEGDVVLNDVSFVAKQGEITALVGPSGGGKSTALKLVSRFWDINKGEITIGGLNMNEIDPETILQHISIVFQDVTLFNQSVLDNIRIGRKDATDEEVIAAAKAAQCHEFVEKMPNGYDSLIGENGFSLSGGERQRISIARALLKDAPIVLLDEATSSLDIQSETAVQRAIKTLTKGKTVLVIAHRMRTIAGANQIIHLKEGIVSESGTHQSLLANKSDYAHMIELQHKSLAWKLV